jgi:hypothetical protein
VECSEEVYGEYVIKEDYAVVHGDLVNALMAVKSQSGKIMDEIAGMFNMPTRGEMDTVHSRFQDSRRAAARLRRELESMREEVLGAGGAKLMEDNAAMKATQKELLARLSSTERMLGELDERVDAVSSGRKSAAAKKKGGKGKDPKKAKKAANRAKKKND